VIRTVGQLGIEDGMKIELITVLMGIDEIYIIDSSQNDNRFHYEKIRLETLPLTKIVKWNESLGIPKSSEEVQKVISEVLQEQGITLDPIATRDWLKEFDRSDQIYQL
jgi:hypothetical protein